jgi:hypothetical protein
MPLKLDSPSAQYDEMIKVDIMAYANHAPAISDQIMLVAVMERVTRAVAALAAETKRMEHVAANGHMRSALDYERKVLAGMKRLTGG